MNISNISIGNRIYGLVTTLLLIATSIAGISLWSMNKIGKEITEIAEQDIPLTEIVTKITVHQLEQAVLLEKGAAHVGQADLPDIHKKFVSLGHQVDEEIKEAEHMLEEAIVHAHSAEAKTEFKKLLTVMLQVEKEHKVYETHGDQAFTAFENDNIDEGKTLILQSEREQEALDKKLEEALFELEAFTARSAIKAEQDEKFALKLIAIVSMVGLGIGIVAAAVIGRSIARPVTELTGVMDTLAADNTDVEVRFVDNRDEVGRMARAVQLFRDQAIEVKRLQKIQGEAEQRAAEERAALLAGVAEQIEGSIGDIAQQMAAMSDQVKGSAQTLSSNAQQTSNQSMTVASTSEQASSNVQTVASAAEELSASISDIGNQVVYSTDITRRAVDEVKGTNAKVQGLSEAANQIGAVVALISDIAEQTNLLALNATIEAARAGEAGKGFAVVATEVKNLAGQTAKATQDISQQVSDIQAQTEDAVGAIMQIGDVIGEINEVSGNIAAAVEQQGAATREIARNVEQAATGTQEVNSSISQVAEAAESTGANADELLSASEEMERGSKDLKDQVVDLTRKLRAA